MRAFIPRKVMGSSLLLLAAAVGGCSSPTPFGVGGAGQDRVTSQADLQDTELERLQNANWDCQQRGPSFVSCAPPGIGLPPIPSLGENGRPAYEIAVFNLDGTPFGVAHFIRADLYQGQSCPFTGQPFVFRAIIGYYECFRVA